MDNIEEEAYQHFLLTTDIDDSGERVWDDMIYGYLLAKNVDPDRASGMAYRIAQRIAKLYTGGDR